MCIIPLYNAREYSKIQKTTNENALRGANAFLAVMKYPSSVLQGGS